MEDICSVPSKVVPGGFCTSFRPQIESDPCCSYDGVELGRTKPHDGAVMPSKCVRAVCRWLFSGIVNLTDLTNEWEAQRVIGCQRRHGNEGVGIEVTPVYLK